MKWGWCSCFCYLYLEQDRQGFGKAVHQNAHCILASKQPQTQLVSAVLQTLRSGADHQKILAAAPSDGCHEAETGPCRCWYLNRLGHEQLGAMGAPPAAAVAVAPRCVSSVQPALQLRPPASSSTCNCFPDFIPIRHTSSPAVGHVHCLHPLLAGPLKLERPLVAFDIESTGLNVSRDRILEIAAVKVWPDGKVRRCEALKQRIVPLVCQAVRVSSSSSSSRWAPLAAGLTGCPGPGALCAR